MRRSKIYLWLDVGTGTRETLEMAFGRKELGKMGLGVPDVVWPGVETQQ